MAPFSKVFSCVSKSRPTGGTIRACYSGISSPPSPPPPPPRVEELKNRHGFGPWLMFTDAENDETGGSGVRRCYSLSSGEIFSLAAPQLQGRRCWGTQHGWLITFGPDCDVHLFNPLTHHQLPLPSSRTIKPLRTYETARDNQTTFFDGFSLSSDSDRLVVMSRYGGCTQLAFSSPGDEAWKNLNESETTYNSDTIFYRGQFYSISCLGELKVCDISKPEEKLITTFPAKRRRGVGYYLVEISGHLHLICRAYGSGPYIYEEHLRTFKNGDYRTIKTQSFDIYRFDFQETKWISIDNLDAHALFVGNNTTFAISATDYPEIKPDYIYFTDDYSQDYKHPFCDMGVYDFGTKTLVEPVPFIKGDNSPISSFSRPFFFIPSLSDL